MTIPAREQQRETRREFKAQIAAQLDNSIEKELLERLRSGTYENFHIQSLKSYDDQIDRIKVVDYDSRKHLEIEYEENLRPGTS